MSGNNFIYDIDVYQGKNATNDFIVEEAWMLPITQKAVVNAIMLSGLANDPDGMHKIYTDNRHSAPPLFVLLHEKYKILACDTIQSNWNGWDDKVMNLPKSSPRGTLLIKFDPIHKIMFGQWNDNKVVSFILSLMIFGTTTCQQGWFSNHKALKCYATDNFMGRDVNTDNDKKIGGSFTSQAMFKKWYWMGLMEVFDVMIINGR